MCPPEAFPQLYSGFGSYAELYRILEQLINGSSPPSDVITDVDPFKYEPSMLPYDVWYFIQYKENSSPEHGSWKVKEFTCEVFSNSSIVGWRTVLEFYEGQVPHEQKTAWTMHEFSLTQKRMYEGCESKEIGTLCKIFRDDGDGQKDFKNMFSAEHALGANNYQPQRSASNASDDSEKSTATKPLVNSKDMFNQMDDEDKLPNHCADNIPKPDNVPAGDYLEMLDLENPASRSSSSDNSSRQSLSSDECFDSLALLRDLEPKDEVSGKTDLSFKPCIAESNQPNEVLLLPPASGLRIEETLTTNNSVPHPVSDNKTAAPKRMLEAQGPDLGREGPSNRNAWSSSCSPDGSQNTEMRSSSTKMKKLKKKYFCFMPF